MKPACAATCLFAALWLGAGVATAASTSYPIEDPLAATVVGTPGKMRADLTGDVPTEVRSLPPLVDRPVPSVLDYAQPLEYTLTAQEGSAPLAFIIAGTGAGALGKKSALLTRALYAEGYHVVTLPSPTSVDFMLGAAQHPIPGATQRDVAALHHMMRAIQGRVTNELDISGYALTGYSLGGLHAAFLARLDARRHDFDFNRVLLVNPSVDLYQSVRRMDALLADNLPGGIRRLPQFIEHALGQFKHIYTSGAPIEFNRDFLYRAYRKADTDRRQFGAIIGLAFRLWLANMTFAADLLTDAGQIVPVDHQLSKSDSLDGYLLQSFAMSFAGYMDDLLVPYYQRGSRSLTSSQIMHQGRLQRIGDYLARSQHIGVITNRDEIILGDDELAFLEDTFGDRATVFDNGGHMGNLAHREVISTIRRFFRR